MPTREEIYAVLATVRDPEIGKPITELDMVKEVTVDGSSVIVEVLLTVAGCPLKDQIRREVTAAATSVPGVEKVHVELGVMTDEQRQAMVGRLRAGQPTGGPAEDKPIGFWSPGSKTRAILVASGKGGVGKSSITANLAVALAQRGHKVGVVDCDVYGYSIPKMLNVTGRPVAFEGMFLPLENHGVKVVSMGFFVPEDQPVIWRGPMLHKALHQFLADAYWGDDIDFILLDMPPGTGDVAISIAQYLPGAEMLVVTTPQEAAQTVAVRAGRMTDQVNLKVLGVVENMSTFVCPNCDEAHRIFGDGGGEKLAQSLNSKVLIEVPIDVRLREGGDEGKPITITDPDSPASKAIYALAGSIEGAKPSLKGKKLPFSLVN
ncbi:MAG: Mrp/NBP35 family ATP-binding protein [Actinomycetota bacterium]